MKTKILYVEDEPFLAKIVSDGLKTSGYEVELVVDGAFAIEAFHSFKPALCILDIMLPSKDGYMIANELRQQLSKLPIIFLSAKVLTEDVIKGFRSGGNDYLKKPFSMEELLVRIESLLDRFGSRSQHLQVESPHEKGIYRFGNCELNIVRQELRNGAGKHILSFKEAALLELLLQHKNDVLQRKDALLKIWGDDSYYNSRSMDVFMTHLRKLLKDEPGIRIMNLRSIGYKLVC